VAFSREQYERRRLVLLLMPVALCLYVVLAPKILGTWRHFALAQMVCPCACPLYQRRSPTPSRNAAALLERDTGTFVAVDYSEYQESLATGSTPIPGTYRADMMAFTAPSTLGLVAPVLRFTNVQVSISTTAAQAPQLADAELVRARLAMADFLEASPLRQNQRFAELLRTGTGEVRETLWFGVFHDATFLLVIAGWFRIALRRSFALRVWRRHRRSRVLRSRRTALDANRCPSCHYDISGLPQGPQHQCPECSEPLWR
jgi:hypothetical protein